MPIQQSFYGLTEENSNRDLSNQTTDQINSSFPVSLLCHMHKKNIEPNYLVVRNGRYVIETIPTDYFFGDMSDVYFNFEGAVTDKRLTKYCDNLPRTDVFISKTSDRTVGTPTEMKLAVMPDSCSGKFPLDQQGPELVVRPDTIAHLAAYLCAASDFSNVNLIFKKRPFNVGADWQNRTFLKKELQDICDDLEVVSLLTELYQRPIICIPTWKTVHYKTDKMEGFDVTFISDAALTKIISEIGRPRKSPDIGRQERAAIWIYTLLYQAFAKGKFDHEHVFETFTYGTYNDKAFALNGRIMNRYIGSQNLFHPRIPASELSGIMSSGTAAPKRIFTEAAQRQYLAEQ